MSTALRFARYEMTRWRGLSALWVVLALALVSSVTLTSLLGASTTVVESDPIRAWAILGTQGVTIGLPPVSAILVSIVGIVVWRDEVVGPGGITTALTFPRRTAVAVSRSVMIAAMVVPLAAAVWFAGVGGALLLARSASVDAFTLVAAVKLVRFVAYCVFLTAIAGAAVLVLRSPVAAGLFLLLVPTAIEPSIVQMSYLLHAPAVVIDALPYLPFTAIADVLATPDPDGFFFGPPHLPLESAVGEASVIAVVCTAVAVLCYRWFDVARPGR